MDGTPQRIQIREVLVKGLLPGNLAKHFPFATLAIKV